MTNDSRTADQLCKEVEALRRKVRRFKAFCWVVVVVCLALITINLAQAHEVKENAWAWLVQQEHDGEYRWTGARRFTEKLMDESEVARARRLLNERKEV